MKKFYIVLATLFTTFVASAQTNIQVQFDWGRNIVYEKAQATVEGNYSDNWGSTYFFGDVDFGNSQGFYGEFSRSFNFWQNSVLKDFSVQVEVDGGLYKGVFINPALLAGINYTFHSIDFSKFLQIQILYKKIFDGKLYTDVGSILLPGSSVCPLQLTFVWGYMNLFRVKGLEFLGFADFWFQNQDIACGKTKTVFMTEPQLWYNAGQHFACNNLSVGGEVELSVNFDTEVNRHVTCYPSVGIRWVF